MSEQPKQYAYSVYQKQSLTNGIIAIEVSFHTDNPDEAKSGDIVYEIFKNTEDKFKQNYKVASLIPENIKQLPSSKNGGSK